MYSYRSFRGSVQTAGARRHDLNMVFGQLSKPALGVDVELGSPASLDGGHPSHARDCGSLKSSPGAGQKYPEMRTSFKLRAQFHALSTLEPDLTDVDGNHQHFLNRPAVRPARVGAALRRQMNSVRNDIA